MIVKEWNQIKNKQFAPVYLLYGEEDYLLQETRQLLIKHVVNEDELDFNFSVHDLSDGASLEAAVEDAESFPFMGERRLVFIDHPVFLTAEKKKDGQESTAALEKYISSPAPYTVLVLYIPVAKLDERKKITKALKKSGVVIEAKNLSEHDLKGWIQSRASASHVKIEDDALEKLVSLTGANLFMLSAEIEKLALFSRDEGVISLKTVLTLTPKSVEQNVFDLIEYAVGGKIDQALDLYHDLLKQKEEPLKILALLAGQFRLIYQVKSMTEKGFSQQQVASRLKVHPYRVKLAQNHARFFTYDQLAQIIQLLAQSDLALKTSSGRKEMVLELFLTRLPDIMKNKSNTGS